MICRQFSYLLLYLESNIELESVINDAKAALSQQYITLKEARDAFDENAAKQQSLAQVRRSY